MPACIRRHLPGHTLGRTLCAALALAAGGCATNPVTGGADFVLMSEDEELKLGARYHRDILKQYRVYDDPALQRYVEEIGQRLASASHRAELDFRFTLLDSADVNAFALPGGYVYITRGIMAYLDSEAELAGVIGHEIGHVTARHSVRQHSQATVTGIVGSVLSAVAGSGSGNLFDALGQALTSGYGRDHELEADRLGAEYLARTGYRPENMIDVIGVLKDQEEFEKAQAREEGREARTYHGVFASHPRNDQRLQEVIGAARKLAPQNTRADDRDTYLARIDGMVFGSAAADGVIRQRGFYHAELDFAFTVPDGWRIHNLADRVIAAPASGDAYAQLDVRDTSADGTPEGELLTRLERDALDDARELPGDYPGYTGRGPARTRFGTRTARFAAWVAGERVFTLAAVAKEPKAMERYDTDFLAIAGSFRKLSPDDKPNAMPLRVQVAPAPAGGYAALARESELDNAEARLRLLNGDFPTGEPAPGARIKVVR